MPVLSATIVDAAFARARSATCRLLGLQHAADDGLVAGSSPLGPTTHSLQPLSSARASAHSTVHSAAPELVYAGKTVGQLSREELVECMFPVIS